jgi:hypothetical protein
MLLKGVGKKPSGSEYSKRRAERGHEVEECKNIYEFAEVVYIKKS